jgi:hypothetical protein
MLAKSPQKMPQGQEIGTEHFHIESHSFLLGIAGLASHWRLMLKNITGLPSRQIVIRSWMVTYRIMRIVSFPLDTLTQKRKSFPMLVARSAYVAQLSRPVSLTFPLYLHSLPVSRVSTSPQYKSSSEISPAVIEQADVKTEEWRDASGQ